MPEGEAAALASKSTRRSRKAKPSAGAEHARLVDAAEAALLLGAVFCPLALGTIHPWSVGVMLACGAVALLAVAAGQHGALPASLCALTLGVVALFIGLQLVPLPPSLLRLLSPEAARTYAFSLEGLDGARAAHPLSLDPPATARELAKAVAYAAAFLAATSLALSRRRRRRLTWALAGTGFAVALLGFGHKLLVVDRLFGSDLFPNVISPFITTFGNRNNAAGFLSLCAPVALALALKGGRRSWLLWGPAYLCMSAGVFLTLSRGGMGGFVAGQLVFGLLLWWQREPAEPRPGALPGDGPLLVPPRRFRRIAAVALGVTSLAIAVGVYLAAEDLGGRIASLSSAQGVRDEGKFRGFAETLPMLAAFPLTGIGKGAFPTVAGRYLTFEGQTAEYVENGPLQALVDLGLPVGGLLIVVLVGSFLLALGRARLSTVQCGLWAGLFSLGLQNLVDFSLELGGVAFPAVLALALVCSPERSSERATQTTADFARPGAGRFWQQVSGKLALALGVIGLVAAVPALIHSRLDWRSETDAFAQGAPRWSAQVALAQAAPILARHPASFVVPLALAQRFLAERAPAKVLHWVNRALFFAPSNPGPHLIAAAALAELGRKSQALLEARTYGEQAPGGAGIAVAARSYPALGDLLQAVPATAAGALELAAYLSAHGRPADALLACAEAVAREPANPVAHRTLAQMLLQAGQLVRAEAEARESLRLAEAGPADEGDAQAYLALAQAQLAQNRLDAAEHTVEGGLRRAAGRQELLLGWLRLELSHGHPDLAEGHFKQLGPPATQAGRAERFQLEGDIAAAEGASLRAEDAYRNAARLRPGIGYEWQLVQTLEGESRFDGAAQVLQELLAHSDAAGRPAIQARIATDLRQASTLQAAGQRAALLGPGTPTP